MKKILYNLLQGIDFEGNPLLSPVGLGYSEANLAIAEKEAYKGVYSVEDDGKPEPEPAPAEDSVWDELDAAYQEGYQEGYTEGVNNAYDQ